jgi:hypothetical protein
VRNNNHFEYIMINLRYWSWCKNVSNKERLLFCDVFNVITKIQLGRSGFGNICDSILELPWRCS